VEISRDRLKEQAAIRAVQDEVRDGMVVGLGTGSTVAFALREIARQIREQGWRIRGVPTSERTATEASRLGIPLVSLDAAPDVGIDGADQVDPALDLIKGGGGAHVREKIVACAALRVVIVADSAKAVAELHGPVPLAILPFALPWILRTLPERMPGSTIRVRMDDDRHGGAAPASAARARHSDDGNILADLFCGPLRDPGGAAAKLDSFPGIVGHGLFIGIADAVYLAGPEGVQVLTRGRPSGKMGRRA
jgi:ribose 5-phosphate isomerase A